MVYRKKTSGKKYAKKTQVFGKMNTSKLIAKKRRSNLVKLIKDTQISESEMKYKSSYVNVGELNHNSITQFHCWHPSTGVNIMDLIPSQGTTDTSRIGDRIYLKGIKIRGIFQVPWDRRSTQLFVYWVPHNSEQGDPSSDLFHNISGATILDPLQKKRYPQAKLLTSVRLHSNDTIHAGANADIKTLTLEAFIPIDKKAYFNADASLKMPNMKEYGTLCLAPYDKTSALETDNVIIGGTMTGTLYYKDI